MDVGEKAFCCVKRKNKKKNVLRNNRFWQQEDIFCTEEEAWGLENREKSQTEIWQKTGTGFQLYLKPEAEMCLMESKY